MLKELALPIDTKVFKQAWNGWGIWVPDHSVQTPIEDGKGRLIEYIAGYRLEYPAEEWKHPNRDQIISFLGPERSHFEFDRNVAGCEWWHTGYSNGSSIDFWFGDNERTETLYTPDRQVIELYILRKLLGVGRRTY